MNRNLRTRTRTFLRKVEEAIRSGDRNAAESTFRAAQPVVMRAKGKVLHRNTASRRLSRLSARIKAMPG